MKKAVLNIVLFVAALAIIGYRFYRGAKAEEQVLSSAKANQEINTKLEQEQRFREYQAQRDAEKAKRDSIFDVQKQEREAKMKQVQENIDKIEKEIKEQK
jgi:uncharacterized protein HemX